jgi:hypothetical protein
MTSHWKAILGVVLIFILGFAAGMVCSSIFVHHKIVDFLQHPGAVAEAAMEKKLTHNLALDENQRQQIHGYFMENLQSRRELNKQIQPGVRIVNLATYREINSVLRPDQRELFRKNLEELRNRTSKVAADTGGDTLPPTGTSSPSPGTTPTQPQ